MEQTNSNEDFMLMLCFSGICTFLVSVLVTSFQIISWLKTANWEPITFYQAGVSLGILDPYFYFDMPNALGVQKILNWFLHSSVASIAFYYSAIVLGICILIAV